MTTALDTSCSENTAGNCFVSKTRVSACMYFLVRDPVNGAISTVGLTYHL